MHIVRVVYSPPPVLDNDGLALQVDFTDIANFSVGDEVGRVSCMQGESNANTTWAATLPI